MRNLAILLSFLLLVGCGEQPETEKIQKKLERGEALTKKQQCIADTMVSSIVDPKNIMLYATVFDVLSRAYIAQNAQIMNYCRAMILGSRQIDELNKNSDGCPEDLKQLSKEQLIALDNQAQSLARMAVDHNDSPLEEVLGSCADL